jgi:hypothetical protein
MSNNIVLSRLFNVLRDIKTTLNSSIAAKASTADLEQHAQDSTAHITAAERTAWNGKAGASHTHSSADISDLQQRLDGIMADLAISRARKIGTLSCALCEQSVAGIYGTSGLSSELQHMECTLLT